MEVLSVNKFFDSQSVNAAQKSGEIAIPLKVPVLCTENDFASSA